MISKELLDLDAFAEVNEAELNCIFAESGRDREMDFDYEADVEFIWSHPETYHLDYPQLKYNEGK